MTRNIVMEKREETKGRVLKRALETHPDQSARPVLVWPQLDKLSTAWLLTLPGPHTGLSAAVFSEATCAHLCLPSPACSDRLGDTVC